MGKSSLDPAYVCGGILDEDINNLFWVFPSSYAAEHVNSIRDKSIVHVAKDGQQLLMGLQLEKIYFLPF